MMSFGGALNSAGFSSKILNNQMPNSDHITYPGVFNEIYFNVGEKPKELIELCLKYASALIPVNQYAKNQIVNSEENTQSQNDYFLGILSKSIKDGQPRDQTPLYAVIILDISGSMDGPIEYKQKQTQKVSRLELAKTAIGLLLEKMRPNDALALVIFDDKAETVYPLTLVSQINKDAFLLRVKSLSTRGGTTISVGFQEGLKCFDNFTHKENGYVERRLIMLTDVGDNSVQGAQKFIQQLTQSKIHSTIIGISSDFQSSTCEELINVKGFNYFCALEDKDLIKFLVDNFDYTFFPFAFNIEISLESSDIDNIEVYGSNDYQYFSSYQVKEKQSFIITKISQSFPSSNQIDENNQVQSEGGLILCKLRLNNQKQNTNGVINLKYQDSTGKNFYQKYEFSNNYHPSIENFSDETLKEGVYSYYYVKCVKELLQEIEKSGKINPQTKETYLEKFQQLRQIPTKTNKEFIDRIIQKLVQQ